MKKQQVSLKRKIINKTLSAGKEAAKQYVGFRVSLALQDQIVNGISFGAGTFVSHATGVPFAGEGIKMSIRGTYRAIKYVLPFADTCIAAGMTPFVRLVTDRVVDFTMDKGEGMGDYAWEKITGA